MAETTAKGAGKKKQSKKTSASERPLLETLTEAANSKKATGKKSNGPKPTAKKSAKTSTIKAEAKTPSTKTGTVAAELPKSKPARKSPDERFLTAIREQIDNCRAELELSLSQSLREDIHIIAEQQIKKANRRRRWSNFFHDLVIILLVAVAVYFGYCLYDVHYFDFWKTECEKNGTCETSSQTTQTTQTAGPVKDSAWYLANYSYLFDNIQTKLDADQVEAYYLYTDDRKVSGIAPEYLLSMAYNQAEANLDQEQGIVTVTASALKDAFQDTFGSAKFTKTDFRHGCLKFQFDSAADLFSAPNTTCALNQNREIVEQIEKIYEEGEVIYVVTNAGIYDKTNQSFYNFDNLFNAVASEVESSDFNQYKNSLNRYQYQFKKDAGKYYFTGIVKLK